MAQTSGLLQASAPPPTPTGFTRRAGPFQKKLTHTAQHIQQQYPNDALEIWAFDEHRLELLPVVKRVWAASGTTPLAPVKPRYQWLFVYGFVRPATGETFWLLLPTISKAAMEVALREFVAHLGIGGKRRVLLVWDNAGSHRNQKEIEGLHIEPLPPYSPELQPAERLWELVDEPLVNVVEETLDGMMETLAKRCCFLMSEARELIRSRTLFHWWPSIEYGNQ